MPTRIMSNPDDAGYRPQASGEQGQVGALACCGMWTLRYTLAKQRG